MFHRRHCAERIGAIDLLTVRIGHRPVEKKNLQQKMKHLTNERTKAQSTSSDRDIIRRRLKSAYGHDISHRDVELIVDNHLRNGIDKVDFCIVLYWKRHMMIRLRRGKL